MGKLVAMHLKVIKPKLCMYAMCVYKFTLNTGFYYYGATTDLGDRISTHLKAYRNSRHAKNIMDALRNATSIKFEFVRFVNNREDLWKWEHYYLMENIGLPLCLNVQEYPSTTYKRDEAFYKVAKVGKDNTILKVYNSLAEAAKDNNISISTISSNCNAKFPITKTYFRRLDESGEIIIPARPMRENPSSSKVVGQYDKGMNFIRQFQSVSEAGRYIGCDRKNISAILKGKTRSTMGFTFREIDTDGNIIEPLFKGKRKHSVYAFKETPKKPISKIDQNGNTLETYRSLYMAMKTIPIERRTLSKILKRDGYYKGFTYKYA